MRVWPRFQRPSAGLESGRPSRPRRRRDWRRPPWIATPSAVSIGRSKYWDSSIRLAWPAGSEFPAQLTQRVGGLAQSDASKRLGLWLDRLRLTGDELAAMTRTIPRVAVIAAERTRVESQLSRSP